MKKKIIFLCLSIALCAVFLGTVHYIEMKQINSSLIYQSDISLKSLQNEYGKGISFQKILSKEKFGDFMEFEIRDFYIENTDFSGGEYYYADSKIINEIVNVFNDYEYYRAPGGDSLIDEETILWDVCLDGSNDINLRVVACKIREKEDIMLLKFMGENIGGGIDDRRMRIWDNTVMYADSALAKRFVKCLEQNTQIMSLALAEEKIASVKNKLPLTDFLNMKHEIKEEYSDTENEDFYTVYIQPLSDFDGYLEIYTLKKSWSTEENVGRAYYIFKINVFDNNGNFQKELYADMESYGKDK